MDIMKKIPTFALLIVLFSIITYGNSHGSENNTNQSPLIGQWISNSCKQFQDDSGAYVDHWARFIYKFTAHGTIQVTFNAYLDSECSQLDETYKNEGSINLDETLFYRDTGEHTLSEGISGRGLTISISENEVEASADAFYTINNRSLCFSKAFSFDALSFGLSEMGDTGIDFEHCLSRL
jgi:hypothetical protein